MGVLVIGAYYLGLYSGLLDMGSVGKDYGSLDYGSDSGRLACNARRAGTRLQSRHRDQTEARMARMVSSDMN